MLNTNLGLNFGLPKDLEKIALAIYLSDILNRKSDFWNIVLSFPTPKSFNNVGGFAIRQFVETILVNLGPYEILKKINPILFNPETGWSSLEIRSINDESVGEKLTIQNKIDLIDILNQSSKIFLTLLIKNLMINTERISFDYGYGYSFDDIFNKNYSYGYGIKYNTLDYFDLII